MKMRVLVIPEDDRKDKYMLEPVFQAMMKHLGQGQSVVKVCESPRLGSVEQALNWERIKQVLQKYKWAVDLFIVCVDRDDKPGRQEQLKKLEAHAQDFLGDSSKLLLAENAWQEIEVWILAGFPDLPSKWSWEEIRAARDPKEDYFLPFAQIRGVLNSPAQGRAILSQEATKKYGRICKHCPELQDLEGRIQFWLDRSS
jgi:hypothetical protein